MPPTSEPAARSGREGDHGGSRRVGGFDGSGGGIEDFACPTNSTSIDSADASDASEGCEASDGSEASEGFDASKESSGLLVRAKASLMMTMVHVQKRRLCRGTCEIPRRATLCPARGVA